MTAKSALQRDLDRFFKAVNNEDFNIRAVTKGGFSKSRRKLDPWAFQRLNEVAVDSFYRNADFNIWGDYRVLAVDGSRLVLPNHASVKAEFGEHPFGPKADSKRSMACCSILYGVLNHPSPDARTAPYTDSEVALSDKHPPKMNPCDLLLLDRGYPGFWLLFLLKARGIGFCVRLKEDWWLKVKDFTGSEELEREAVFSLPKKDRKKLAGYPHCQDTTITCRLIKVILAGGSKEILCTSLLDTKKYPYEEFAELYRYRWGEEEACKLLKSRAGLEDFSGKTAIAVRQDFFAKILLMSLCAVYAFPIEEKVREEYKADDRRKYSQQINHTHALAMTRDILTGVFLKNQFHKAIQAFDQLVEKTREIIRPGRSVLRNKKPKKPYAMAYKRL